MTSPDQKSLELVRRARTTTSTSYAKSAVLLEALIAAVREFRKDPSVTDCQPHQRVFIIQTLLSTELCSPTTEDIWQMLSVAIDRLAQGQGEES